MKNINFGFFTQQHIPMCVYSTVYSVLSPSLVKTTSQAYYSGWIRTHDPCDSRAVSYQLDYLPGSNPVRVICMRYFFHMTRESTEYLVLTHIGVRVNKKIYIYILL